MTAMWNYADGQLGSDADITGYKVRATDGAIGKVDEATYRVGRSYIIVDTGPWIFHRVVLLPAGIVDTIDHEEKVVRVSRSKAQIKAAPVLTHGHRSEAFDRDPFDAYYSSPGPKLNGL